MKDRNMRAHICAVLFASLISSVAFAQVSAVTDRASLGGTDSIDWQVVAGYTPDSFLIFPQNPDPATPPFDPANIQSAEGVSISVIQDFHYGASVLTQEPSVYFTDPLGVPLNTNLPDVGFLYVTYYGSTDPNRISFSGFDGAGICGLGTQVAPAEAGEFIVQIDAYDGGGLSLIDSILFPTATTDPVVDTTAQFFGVSSVTPMDQVDISIQSTGGGANTDLGWYAINQVDLKPCTSGPVIPQLSCEGFAAPMDRFPVKAKKNRVLPLKMELFDDDGFAVTDIELAAAPVVTVLFSATQSGDVINLSDSILSSGNPSDGNQFEFKGGIWQFRLSSKPYTAAGTYTVEAVSGDNTEYVIDESCITSFVKE